MPCGKIWMDHFNSSIGPPIFLVFFPHFLLLRLTAEETPALLRPPNWYDHDHLPTGYRCVSVTSTNAIVVTIGDGVLFIIYHCYCRLSDSFLAPVSFLWQGRLLRQLAFTEIIHLRPPLTIAMAAVIANEIVIPGNIFLSSQPFSSQSPARHAPHLTIDILKPALPIVPTGIVVRDSTYPSSIFVHF